MRLLALLTPCAVLALLWALQRLEAWMKATSGPHGPRRSPSAQHPGKPAPFPLEGAHHG